MLIMHNIVCRYGTIVLWLFYTCSISLTGASGRDLDRPSRIRCPRPDAIPNGSYRLKRNNMLMRVNCKLGYTLIGPRVIDCVNGKWYGEKPLCAKKGCSSKLQAPENGLIQIENDYKTTLFCSDNYNVAGNRFAYCNGSHWDRELGNCRVRKNAVEHECDFETEDICGWVYEQTEDYEWKRVVAANIFTSSHTGPTHDHTTMTASGGHYMLVESLGRTQAPISLMSPIYKRDLSLKTACCFRFYYFMYGSGVGDLYVLVKPASVNFEQTWLSKDLYVKFKKSGYQNNIWNEAIFNIDEMDEDFQIVFVATGAKNHLSDIAIDDVKLLIGDECKSPEKSESDEADVSDEQETATEAAVYDTQSCVGRCSEISGASFVVRNGHVYRNCSCQAQCEEDDTCCLDYRAVCLNSYLFSESTQSQQDTTPTYADLPTNRAAPKEHTTSNVSIETTSTIRTSTQKAVPKRITSTSQANTKSSSTTTMIPTTKTTMATTPTTKLTTKNLIKVTTTPKPIPSTTTKRATTTTTTTTSRKPTTRRSTSKLYTLPTTTRRTTTSTIKTTTTPKATTTTKITTTTPSTTSATTRKPTTQRTTSVNQNAVKSSVTKAMPPLTNSNMPERHRKTGKNTDKPQLKKQNIATWIVDHETGNGGRSKTDYHHGSGFMKLLLVLIVGSICVSAVFYRYKYNFLVWYNTRKNKDGQNAAHEETASITAKFSPKTTVEGIGSDNKGALKSKSKRKTKQTFYSSDMRTPLWENEVYESDEDDDSIALQNKNSTNF